jgi:hypothetical protein
MPRRKKKSKQNVQKKDGYIDEVPSVPGIQKTVIQQKNQSEKQALEEEASKVSPDVEVLLQKDVKGLKSGKEVTVLKGTDPPSVNSSTDKFMDNANTGNDDLLTLDVIDDSTSKKLGGRGESLTYSISMKYEDYTQPVIHSKYRSNMTFSYTDQTRMVRFGFNNVEIRPFTQESERQEAIFDQTMGVLNDYIPQCHRICVFQGLETGSNPLSTRTKLTSLDRIGFDIFKMLQVLLPRDRKQLWDKYEQLSNGSATDIVKRESVVIAHPYEHEIHDKVYALHSARIRNGVNFIYLYRTWKEQMTNTVWQIGPRDVLQPLFNFILMPPRLGLWFTYLDTNEHMQPIAVDYWMAKARAYPFVGIDQQIVISRLTTVTIPKTSEDNPIKLVATRISTAGAEDYLRKMIAIQGCGRWAELHVQIPFDFPWSPSLLVGCLLCKLMIRSEDLSLQSINMIDNYIVANMNFPRQVDVPIDTNVRYGNVNIGTTAWARIDPAARDFLISLDAPLGTGWMTAGSYARYPLPPNSNYFLPPQRTHLYDSVTGARNPGSFDGYGFLQYDRFRRFVTYFKSTNGITFVGNQSRNEIGAILETIMNAPYIKSSMDFMNTAIRQEAFDPLFSPGARETFLQRHMFGKQRLQLDIFSPMSFLTLAKYDTTIFDVINLPKPNHDLGYSLHEDLSILTQIYGILERTLVSDKFSKKYLRSKTLAAMSGKWLTDIGKQIGQYFMDESTVHSIPHVRETDMIFFNSYGVVRNVIAANSQFFGYASHFFITRRGPVLPKGQVFDGSFDRVWYYDELKNVNNNILRITRDDLDKKVRGNELAELTDKTLYNPVEEFVNGQYKLTAQLQDIRVDWQVKVITEEVESKPVEDTRNMITIRDDATVSVKPITIYYTVTDKVYTISLNSGAFVDNPFFRAPTLPWIFGVGHAVSFDRLIPTYRESRKFVKMPDLVPSTARPVAL